MRTRCNRSAIPATDELANRSRPHEWLKRSAVAASRVFFPCLELLLVAF